MSSTSIRRFAVVAAGALALAAAGCKTSPCAPPPSMADAQAVNPPPPPAPRYVAPAPRPCPPPPPAPVVDPAEQARLEAMKRQVEEQNRKNAELEAQSNRLAEEQRAREAAAKDAVRLRAQAQEAAKQLGEELKGLPGAQVLVEGTRVAVLVTDSFASGSDQLKTDPNIRAALQGVAGAIAKHPEARISVVGHTDGQPIRVSKWPDNLALSKARAEAVAKVLVEAGAARERLAVDGVGDREPVAVPETTAADRARNRRVEVAFEFAPAGP